MSWSFSALDADEKSLRRTVLQDGGRDCEEKRDCTKITTVSMLHICGNDHTSSLITAWRKLHVLMAPTVQERLSAAALQRPEAATAPSAHDREGKKRTYLIAL